METSSDNIINYPTNINEQQQLFNIDNINYNITQKQSDKKLRFPNNSISHD